MTQLDDKTEDAICDVMNRARKMARGGTEEQMTAGQATYAPPAEMANLLGAAADAIDVMLKRNALTQEWLDRFQGDLAKQMFRNMILEQRVSELLQYNNEFEERARKAERECANMKDDLRL